MQLTTMMALGLALSAGTLSAQDSVPIPMQGIEVTVLRVPQPLALLPAAVTVLGRSDIQPGQPGIGIEEALVMVPGVTVNNRYNFALGTRVSIRGFGARAAFGVRGIGVLSDGIPLTMPDGQTNLNNIDVSSTGRIEVLRGAASMLYGNAAGGVIAFETEKPNPGFVGQFRVVAGAGDMLRVNAKAGGGSSATRYLFNASHLAADGFREHARVEQSNFTARVRRDLNDRAYITLTVNVADVPTALNPGSLPRDSAQLRPEMAWPRNAATKSGEAARQIQTGIEHGNAWGATRVNLIVYGVSRTLENPLPFAYIRLDRRAGGVRSLLTTSVGSLVVSTGLDAQVQLDERSEFDNVLGEAGENRSRDQTEVVRNVGPFARVSAALTSALAAHAGVRYDRTKFEIDDDHSADGLDDSGARAMSAWSPMAGLTYRIDARMSTFISVSTSFQTPTTTELINNPERTAGFNALDPQRATSMEAGFRVSRPRIAGEVAVYHTNVRDAIVPFQVPDGGGREFFRNAGHTRQDGFEAALHILPHNDLRIAASYTYNRFVFVDDGVADAFEGNQLPGVPPHHFSSRVTWTRALWFLEPEVEFTSAYFAADSNMETSRTAAATVIDIRAGAVRPIAGLMPFLGINNVLDRRYIASVVINAAGARYFEPAPPRNVYFGLSAVLGR